MNEFGKQLRRYRRHSTDPAPDRDGLLTQARLGELLGNELGIMPGYSGAAVSEWERGKSRIHHTDRAVLAALIKVLHDCGGIRDLDGANEFLWAGDYRPLDETEQRKTFPELEPPPSQQKIEQPETTGTSQPEDPSSEYPSPGNRSGRFSLGVTLTVLGAVFIVWLLLPRIAIHFNNAGFVRYRNGDFREAERYYRLASLYPGYSEAHYNLGLLYEDQFDFGTARREYEIALDGELDAAYNNLARLHILEGSYPQAISLLQRGLKIAEDEDVLYAMHKNMGWALFGQKRFNEAASWLREAIVLKGDRAAAYCLLAQVLEGQGDPEAALGMWENCLKYANGTNPDENIWIGMAHQRLDTQG
ncbi:MAG: tetratricopeptide repeat protein [Anaerolineales bacterium]